MSLINALYHTNLSNKYHNFITLVCRLMNRLIDHFDLSEFSSSKFLCGMIMNFDMLLSKLS